MLGRQIATHVAGVGNFRNRQGGVLVWSGEQDREETAMCMAYQYARLAEWKLKDKQYMTRKDWNDLTEAVADISAAPLWIIDQPEITPLRLRAEIRAVKRLAEKKRVQEAQQDLEYPPDERRPSPELKFVLVDYLQLMGSAGLVEKNANREREVSAISRKLKQIAASEKVVIALCAQLNKDGDKRGKDDSTPRNGDLRESNSIEQDADKIILIHNPHAAERAKAVRDSDERKDPEPEVARLIVGKARQGGTTGTVRTVFLPTCGRFEPYDGRHDPEAN
jgi:replicative DNA helicase